MAEITAQPFRRPSMAALELTIELIRAGKIGTPEAAAKSVIAIREALSEHATKLKDAADK